MYVYKVARVVEDMLRYDRATVVGVDTLLSANPPTLARYKSFGVEIGPVTKTKAYKGAPRICNACTSPFGKVMYDASTKRGWGNFCQDCFDELGCSLGIGRGQKYHLKDGEFWKVAG